MSLKNKFCVSVGVVVALAASVATAQTRDAGAKTRGEFGGSPSSGGMARSMGPVYRAPAMTTEAPSNDRTFSYEPGQASVAGGGCGATGEPVQSSAPQAQSNGRTYSYEPSRAYYGRGMADGRSSVPTFALPRTDARKHNGGR